MRILFPGNLDFVPQSALDRGTQLHEAMEVWVNNQLHEYQDPGVLDEGIRPVIAWMATQPIVLESAEEEVFHKFGVRGHPDLLCRWRTISYWFDWKFVEQLSEINLVQGTAYNYLTGRKGVFIQCNKAGEVTIHRCKTNPSHWSAFVSGLNVWKFQHRQQAYRTEAQLQQDIQEIKEALCQMEK
ncbi:MAG: hypothetical protein KC590_16875 [Nitrospira sp.]|nr:hypothetical protein [Nitrospira sp.]